MKKSLACLALVLAAAAAFAQSVDVVLYCDDGYPPYAYMEAKEAKGIYVDIIREAAARMKGYRVEIVPVPWKRALQYAESGEAFGIFPPYKRTKERPFMDYEIKLLDEEVVLLVRDEGVFTEKSPWPDAFKGKKIGINSGYVFLNEWKEKGLITVDEVQTNEMNITKLALKRIDAYANERFAMLATLAAMRKEGKSLPKMAIGPTISREEAFLATTNRDGGKFAFKADFTRRMVAAIEELRASGRIRSIIAAYTE